MPFGVFYGHLVYFEVSLVYIFQFWYIERKKSGNPAFQRSGAALQIVRSLKNPAFDDFSSHLCSTEVVSGAQFVCIGVIMANKGEI
jgi:hypothetical protein